MASRLVKILDIHFFKIPAHSRSSPLDVIKEVNDGTNFRMKVLFEPVDSIYRQDHGLTVTSNYSMLDLVERERLHPAIVRRLDDMCRVVEV